MSDTIEACSCALFPVKSSRDILAYFELSTSTTLQPYSPAYMRNASFSICRVTTLSANGMAFFSNSVSRSSKHNKHSFRTPKTDAIAAAFSFVKVLLPRSIADIRSVEQCIFSASFSCVIFARFRYSLHRAPGVCATFSSLFIFSLTFPYIHFVRMSLQFPYKLYYNLPQKARAFKKIFERTARNEWSKSANPLYEDPHGK